MAVSDEDDCSETSHNPPTVVFTNAQGQDFCTLNENMLTPVGDYVTAFTSGGGSSRTPVTVARSWSAPSSSRLTPFGTKPSDSAR